MPRRSRARPPSTISYALGHRVRIARCGASPDLCVLTQTVADALSVTPSGVTTDDLVGFVCRNSFSLSTTLWQAYRSVAPYNAHPEDGYPDRVGVVTRSMSLAEVERAIHQQTEEHTVLFDAADLRQVARFGPEGTTAAGFTAHNSTFIGGQAIQWGRESKRMILTHNHPTGAFFSGPDFEVAFHADLQEIRAVGPDGWGYVMRRGTSGWPLPHEASKLLKAASEQAYILTTQEFEYEYECVGARDEVLTVDDVWREKYAEVCMDPAFWRKHGFHEAPDVEARFLVPPR